MMNTLTFACKAVFLYLLLMSAPAMAFDIGGITFSNGSSNNNTVDPMKVIKVVRTGKKISGAFIENEKNVGMHASASLLGASPLLRSHKIQSYINNVGRWVASHTERGDEKWRFGVLNDRSVNAFSAPGGYIFLTAGLMYQLADESQLAGVLAHEVAHVLREHHMKALKSSALKDVAVDLSSVVMENRLQMIAAQGLLNVWSSGLPKEDEYEADRAGVVIATRAGYEPWGLYSVLQKLDSLTVSRNQNIDFMNRTHPLPAERLELLAKPMDALDRYAGNPQVHMRYMNTTAMLR